MPETGIDGPVKSMGPTFDLWFKNQDIRPTEIKIKAKAKNLEIRTNLFLKAAVDAGFLDDFGASFFQVLSEKLLLFRFFLAIKLTMR